MRNKTILNVKENSTEVENSNRLKLTSSLKNTPINHRELIQNLPLFLTRQNLSQILFINDLYKKIIETHGVILEFGVRWGRNIALYQNLRGIYEPFNHNRKIVGFDTFEGFPSVSSEDGTHEIIKKGSYNVSENYQDYLTSILNIHESESPISHIMKYELIKGDVTLTLEPYLQKHPELIVSFAYFDFDIYKPTKHCLEQIRDRLTKGSVIAFDELNHADYPGETIALREVFGLSKYKIHHSNFSPTQSYIVID